MKKITFSEINPDQKTLDWVLDKIVKAHFRELCSAMSKAHKAVTSGESAVIRTKPVIIRIESQS